MAIDKVPPRPEEGNTAKNVSEMLDYLYYLREQMNYELNVIKKNFDKEENNNAAIIKALETANGETANAISELAERITTLENA